MLSKQTMDNELIRNVNYEIEVIDSELDFQTEKYLNIQKKLGESSSILNRNRMLLNNLKKATEMREILKFMGIMALIVLIIVLIKNREYILEIINRKQLKF